MKLKVLAVSLLIIIGILAQCVHACTHEVTVNGSNDISVSPDDVVAIGDTLDFTISTASSDTYCSEGCSLEYSWAVDGGSSLGSGTEESGDILKLSESFSSSGFKTMKVTAKCTGGGTGEGSAEVDFTVVEIDYLQYGAGSSWEDFTMSTLYFPVVTGSELNLVANPKPSGASWPSGLPTWSGGATPSAVVDLATFPVGTVSSSSTGTSFTVTCGTSSITKNITVFEVEKIQYEDDSGSWTDFSGTLRIPIGDTDETLLLNAVSNPSGITWPNNFPVWSGGGVFSVTPGEAEFLIDEPSSSSSGTTVTATTGSTSTSEDILVVGIDTVQYEDPDSGDTDITDALYILKGTTVEFTVIEYPSGSVWPDGKPVWGGLGSGTGDTCSVTFDTLSASDSDFQAVTVECGETFTFYVMVYDFAGEIVPCDDFAGRSAEKSGIEEEFALGCIIEPSGVTAAQIGGLRWSVVGSVGSVFDLADDGTGACDAEDIEGDVELELTLLSGLSAGTADTFSFEVIKPTGTYITYSNPGVVWHVNGMPSAGFSSYYWLEPKNVSFANLTFGEGTAATTNDTGCYENHPDHPQNYFGTILSGDISTGCRVEIEDTAACWEPTDWSDGGTCIWNIPTQYIDDTGVRSTFGSAMVADNRIETNGTATVTKDVLSGSAELDDPDSDF